jgi:hypothetical protein
MNGIKYAKFKTSMTKLNFFTLYNIKKRKKLFFLFLFLTFYFFNYKIELYFIKLE